MEECTRIFASQMTLESPTMEFSCETRVFRAFEKAGQNLSDEGFGANDGEGLSVRKPRNDVSVFFL